MIVREAPPDLQMMVTQASKHDVTTWCCMNQGPSSIQARFERNQYEPTEVVKADAIIQNKDCNIAMTGIRLAIE